MSDPRLGVTRLEVMDLLTRYEAIYGRTDIGRETVIAEWHRALRSLPLDVLNRALDTIRDTYEGNARPKVGLLKRTARRLMVEDRPETAVGPDGVCNVCHTHFWYAGYEMPNGQVHPRPRCGCPPSGSGWDTEAAAAWRETDANILAAGWRTPRKGAA